MTSLNRREFLISGGHAALLAGLIGSGRSSLFSAVSSNGRQLFTGAAAGITPAAAEILRAAAYTVGSPVGPLQLVSDVTMSQDWFLSSDVWLGDDTDAVSPVIVDGALGAVVLENGVPYVLAPDPTVPTGWTYTAFMPGGTPAITSLSAVTLSDGSVDVTLVSSDGISVLTGSLRNHAYTPVGQEGVYFTMPPRPCVGPDGTPALYSMSYEDGGPDGSVWNTFTVATPDRPGSLPLVLALDTTVAGYPVGLIQDAVLIAAITDGDPPSVYGLVNDGRNGYFLNGSTVSTTSAPGLPKPLAPAIGNPNPQDGSTVVAFLYTDVDTAQVWAIACDDLGTITAQAQLGLFSSGTIGTVTSAAWFADGTGVLYAYLVAADDDGDGSALYLQTIDLTNGAAVTQPVPIAADVADVYLPQRAATPDTALFVRSIDSTLQVLSRNSTTGAWSAAPVQQGGPSNQEVTTYRTMLTVLDANGNPCPNVDLAITPSYDQIVWQPGGSATMPGGVATTFTTDDAGVVTLATPAVALHAPQLSITSSVDGFPSDPQLVSPDAELHAYLAGTGSLLNNPTLTGAALQSATASDGTPLCPALQSDTSGASADAIVQSINQTMTAGASAQAGTLGSMAIPGFTLRNLGRETPPTIHPPQRRAVDSVLGDWFNDVKHDIESVFKAIESGVIKITEATVSAVEGAAEWVVNLAIEIGDGVESVIEYTITDLRTAAIAVAGVLHAIGAAIDEAVQWLRLIVLDLLADTKHLADVMYSWMTVQGPAAVGSALAASSNAVDGLFAGLKSDIAGFFHSNLPSGTFGSSKPAPPPAGSPQAQASGGNHNVKMTWLHDKLKGSTGPTPPEIGSTHADNIVATLTAQVDTLEADLETAFDPFIHPDPPIENPADFKDLFSWSTLDQLATGILDTACDVADDLIVDVLGFIGDGVTGIVDAMQTPLGSIGGIGDLFDILGIGAVTPGELVCYLIAFPAVIAGDLIALVAGGNHDWIPSLPSALGAGDLLGGFDIGAAVAMVLAVAEITYGALFAAFNTALVVLIASGWPPVNLSLPWYVNWLLNGLQLLIHLLEYPFQSTIVTTATDTWLPATVDWGGGVWVGGLSSQAPLFTWLLGFLPDIVSALQKPGPLWGGFQMIVNTFFGFILTGLSLGIAITSDPDAVVLGEAIVGWLPSMFSALMLPASLVSTAGITGAIGVDLNVLESDVYAGFSFAAFAAAI